MNKDNWENREMFICKTCMHYINTRCRKHAPTLSGFPAVYLTDWCGDHKITKQILFNENGGKTCQTQKK